MIGERIKALRKEKGLTQKQLSKAASISEISIRKYESGNRTPKQTAIYNIAKALDVNEAWLMGFDVPMERKDYGYFLAKQSSAFTSFVKYLESINYVVRFEKDESDSSDYNESYNATLTKGKTSLKFTEEEFESFKTTIEKAVEFEVFKLISNK